MTNMGTCTTRTPTAAARIERQNTEHRKELCSNTRERKQHAACIVKLDDIGKSVVITEVKKAKSYKNVQRRPRQLAYFPMRMDFRFLLNPNGDRS